MEAKHMPKAALQEIQDGKKANFIPAVATSAQYMPNSVESGCAIAEPKLLSKQYSIVDSAETLALAFERVRGAQREMAKLDQANVDRIFKAAAMAANSARIPLAKMAAAETGMGIVEDKVIKNHYASEYIYNAYKDTKTCEIIEEDPAFGIRKIAEPIGVIAAVIPTTNPTSTAIFKALLALKNAQRHHHQPASACKGMYHRRRRESRA